MSCSDQTAGLPKAKRSSLAASTRLHAEIEYGSGTHIRNLRLAIGETFASKMQAYLREGAVAKSAVLNVSFDETETQVISKTVDDETAGTQSLFMLHASLHKTIGQGCKCIVEDTDIPCPPAFLEDTRGATIFSAVRRRLPLAFAEMAKKTAFVLAVHPNSQ